MAYREVRMMDIDQVMRRWLVGDGIRAIGRSTGLDRNTVRRIVRLAEQAGMRRDTPWPDEGKLQAIRQGMGRSGAAVAPSEAARRLKPRTDQIRAWLEKDDLLLTKVHKLLGREGEGRRRWELSGMNLAVLRQQMGHSSAVMTARYTGEIPLDKVQEAFTKMELEYMEVIGKTAALYWQSLSCV